jgi:hypothetical protein
MVVTQTEIRGFRQPTPKWQDMAKLWELCVEYGIDPPEEVYDVIGFEEPDLNLGEEVDIGNYVETKFIDSDSAFTIKLENLPAYVTHIQVYVKN